MSEKINVEETLNFVIGEDVEFDEKASSNSSLDKPKSQFRIVMHEQLSGSEFARFTGTMNVRSWKYLFLYRDQGQSKESQTTSQDIHHITSKAVTAHQHWGNTLLPSKAQASRSSDRSHSAGVESNPDDIKPREDCVRNA